MCWVVATGREVTIRAMTAWTVATVRVVKKRIVQGRVVAVAWCGKVRCVVDRRRGLDRSSWMWGGSSHWLGLYWDGTSRRVGGEGSVRVRHGLSRGIGSVGRVRRRDGMARHKGLGWQA